MTGADLLRAAPGAHACAQVVQGPVLVPACANPRELGRRCIPSRGAARTKAGPCAEFRVLRKYTGPVARHPARLGEEVRRQPAAYSRFTPLSEEPP